MGKGYPNTINPNQPTASGGGSGLTNPLATNLDMGNNEVVNAVAGSSTNSLATVGQVQGLISTVSAENWATYTATTNVNMNGKDLTNTGDITANSITLTNPIITNNWISKGMRIDGPSTATITGGIWNQSAYSGKKLFYIPNQSILVLTGVVQAGCNSGYGLSSNPNVPVYAGSTYPCFNSILHGFEILQDSTGSHIYEILEGDVFSSAPISFPSRATFPVHFRIEYDGLKMTLYINDILTSEKTAVLDSNLEYYAIIGGLYGQISNLDYSFEQNLPKPFSIDMNNHDIIGVNNLNVNSLSYTSLSPPVTVSSLSTNLNCNNHSILDVNNINSSTMTVGTLHYTTLDPPVSSGGGSVSSLTTDLNCNNHSILDVNNITFNNGKTAAQYSPPYGSLFNTSTLNVLVSNNTQFGSIDAASGSVYYCDLATVAIPNTVTFDKEQEFYINLTIPLPLGTVITSPSSSWRGYLDIDILDSTSISICDSVPCFRFSTDGTFPFTYNATANTLTIDTTITSSSLIPVSKNFYTSPFRTGLTGPYAMVISGIGCMQDPYVGTAIDNGITGTVQILGKDTTYNFTVVSKYTPAGATYIALGNQGQPQLQINPSGQLRFNGDTLLVGSQFGYYLDNSKALTSEGDGYKPISGNHYISNITVFPNTSYTITLPINTAGILETKIVATQINMSGFSLISAVSSMRDTSSVRINSSGLVIIHDTNPEPMQYFDFTSIANGAHFSYHILGQWTNPVGSPVNTLTFSLSTVANGSSTIPNMPINVAINWTYYKTTGVV